MGLAELLGELHVLLLFLAFAIALIAGHVLLQVTIGLAFARLCDAIEERAAEDWATLGFTPPPYRSIAEFLGRRRLIARVLFGMDAGMRTAARALRGRTPCVEVAERVARDELRRLRRPFQAFVVFLMLVLAAAGAMLVYAVDLLFRVLDA